MTNQHRCETCESNLKEKAEGDSIWCAKSEEWLVTRPAQRIINELGCASHSDFQNQRDMSVEEFVLLAGKMEAAVRKDEMVRGLDEIQENLEVCMNASEWCKEHYTVYMRDVKFVLEELRSSKEERG